MSLFFYGFVFVIILMNEFIDRKTRVNTWLDRGEILLLRNRNFNFGLLRGNPILAIFVDKLTIVSVFLTNSQNVRKGQTS